MAYETAYSYWAYSYWMSGFVDIIHVAKCPIDKMPNAPLHFFVKLSMSITKDLCDSHIKVWMCVHEQLEQLRHVIMYLQSSMYKINYAYNKQYISPACVPVPVFPKDGTKGHKKEHI
jgi:hypothetical protein